MDIFDGVELSDEQKATIQANHDKTVSESFVTKDELHTPPSIMDVFALRSAKFKG